MNKCDVILPVYNSPEWVKICVYALFENTPSECLNRLIVVDDCSDDCTYNLLLNLSRKYRDKIALYRNQTNLGFVKTVNYGLSLSDAEYIMLLNSDCLVARNTIPKLISHINKDKDIGLICPLSNNAANLSLPIFEGFSYLQMDRILESKFSGMSYDACTVVGNCLMISRSCMDVVGYFDEIYGKGYGEETDYQFKAQQKGFKSKVAIDTYVYHKAGVSFGESEEKKMHIENNRRIFFDRWEKEYSELLQHYKRHDPIEFVSKNLSGADKVIVEDVVIYLPDIIQNAGGVHVVVEIVNYLNLAGMNASILCERLHEYREPMVFEPIKFSHLFDMKAKKIVATINTSAFVCEAIGRKLNIPFVYFAQGYEVCFEDGCRYGMIEMTYKIADEILTISNFLQEKLKRLSNVPSTVILNGINLDLFYYNRKVASKRKQITLFIRGSSMKGDMFIVDIIKMLTLKAENIDIHIFHNDPYAILPVNNNNTIKFHTYPGHQNRSTIAKVLHKTDIFLDTSLFEGFGLLPLEAMAAGAVPVVSNSFGIAEFLRDGENGMVVKEVNNADRYVEKIQSLLSDDALWSRLSKEAQKTALNFDFDGNIKEYFDYFKKDIPKRDLQLTVKEQSDYKRYSMVGKLEEALKKAGKFYDVNNPNRKEKIFIFLRKVNKHLPRFVKIFLSKLRTLLNNI